MKKDDVVDKDGMFIEDFDFSLNLVFCNSNIVESGFEEAIKTLD